MQSSKRRKYGLTTLLVASAVVCATVLVGVAPASAGASVPSVAAMGATSAGLFVASSQGVDLSASVPPARPTSGAGGGGGGGVPEGYFSRVSIWDDTHAPPVSECLGACRSRESGAEVRYNRKCRGGNQWGDWEGVQGLEEGRHNFKPGAGRTPGHTWYSSADYDCVSAAAWVETPVNCVITFTTSVVGPLGNPYVPSATTVLHRQEETAFAQTGKTKPALCDRSRALPVGATLDHYGKWRIKATRRIATCTLYTYVLRDTRTKRLPPPRIDHCATLPSGPIAAKAEVVCERPGWATGGSTNHDYTPQDCLTHQGGVWDCGPQLDPARLDGRPAAPANITNDGEDHSLHYSAPVPRGAVRNIHEDRVRLRYLGGTPRRAGVDNAADTQPFIVNPTIDDWVYGWSGMGADTGTEFVVNFQAASVAGKPWSAAPEWAFTAGFGKTVPDVRSIDAFTSGFDAVDAYDWERLPALCTGAPAQVSVFAPRQR